MSVLTTPNYTGIIPLGPFISKEISKYICGHNELLMVLHLNDHIVNEVHSRDTLSLLSLVSAFTDTSVRSCPNDTIYDAEYEALVKKKKNERLKTKLGQLEKNLKYLEQINQTLKLINEEEEIYEDDRMKENSAFVNLEFYQTAKASCKATKIKSAIFPTVSIIPS